MAWGSVLTSESWTTGPLRTHTCYHILLKLLIACKALSGSSHSIWSQDTGRLRWMRKANHWLHSQWGQWASTSAKGWPLDSLLTLLPFRDWWRLVLGTSIFHWCIIYLDDLVIFSKDLVSHLERLEAVFQKLEKAGLKLKPSKCELFQWQISYLGHVISAQRVATDKGEIATIKNFPTPTNITEVQSFLGFMEYYCWFIPKFAQVAWPLHELTSGENADKKKAAIQLNSKCQQAFNDLKRLCTPAPILAYADFTKPFKLHTDAYGSGLGGVLYQTHEDGTDAVIAYASRSLSKAESHYPIHKLEFLALKWTVVKKFHEYLYGLIFDIYTDNNPLTYVLTTAKLDAASHCWVVSLANYNFQLHYQVRKANIDADALSRVSWPGCMPDNSGTHLNITAATVQAVQGAALEGPASPIKAYSYDLHILDAVQGSQQVTCMTLED